MVKRTGSGLLLVMIDVEEEHEEEFNRWYDQEHFPERLQCPGFLSGRRFVAVEGEPKYLAIYDLESPEVLERPEYLRIRPPSRWQERVAKHWKRSVRNVYRDITPEIPSNYRVRAVR
jgi:rubrerythrin